MATKTITIEMDAYDALVRARQHPRESFTEVVRRAQWDDKQYTGRALLAFIRERARTKTLLSEEAIEALAVQDLLGTAQPSKAKQKR